MIDIQIGFRVEFTQHNVSNLSNLKECSMKPQLAVYPRQDNLRCLYEHDFGEVVPFPASEPNQENHGLFKPYGRDPFVANLKSFVCAGSWVDLGGYGWAIVENVKPKPF